MSEIEAVVLFVGLVPTPNEGVKVFEALPNKLDEFEVVVEVEFEKPPKEGIELFANKFVEVVVLFEVFEAPNEGFVVLFEEEFKQYYNSFIWCFEFFFK